MNTIIKKVFFVIFILSLLFSFYQACSEVQVSAPGSTAQSPTPTPTPTPTISPIPIQEECDEIQKFHYDDVLTTENLFPTKEGGFVTLTIIPGALGSNSTSFIIQKFLPSGERSWKKIHDIDSFEPETIVETTSTSEEIQYFVFGRRFRSNSSSNEILENRLVFYRFNSVGENPQLNQTPFNGIKSQIHVWNALELKDGKIALTGTISNYSPSDSIPGFENTADKILLTQSPLDNSSWMILLIFTQDGQLEKKKAYKEGLWDTGGILHQNNREEIIIEAHLEPYIENMASVISINPLDLAHNWVYSENDTSKYPSGPLRIVGSYKNTYPQFGISKEHQLDALFPNCMIPTNEGGYLVSKSGQSNPNQPATSLIKFTSNFTKSWQFSNNASNLLCSFENKNLNVFLLNMNYNITTQSNDKLELIELNGSTGTEVARKTLTSSSDQGWLNWNQGNLYAHHSPLRFTTLKNGFLLLHWGHTFRQYLKNNGTGPHFMRIHPTSGKVCSWTSLKGEN